MKKACKMFVCGILIIVLSIPIAAHSSTQRYNIDSENPPQRVGTEDMGWVIDETRHTNGTAVTYYFRTGTFELSDELKTVFRSAASMWSSIVTFTESSSQGGEINAISNAIYPAAAEFSPISTDSSGHLTGWSIQINTHWYDEGEDTASEYATYMAHELGHVIGLNDLYSSQNYNKLMCSSADYMTVTTPRTADLNGARVITGVHSTHTWSKTSEKHSCSGCGGYGTHSPDNSRCSYSSNNASTHTVYCRVCSYSYSESHSDYYDSTIGECTACGYTGVIQMNIEDENE